MGMQLGAGVRDGEREGDEEGDGDSDPFSLDRGSGELIFSLAVFGMMVFGETPEQTSDSADLASEDSDVPEIKLTMSPEIRCQAEIMLMYSPTVSPTDLVDRGGISGPSKTRTEYLPSLARVL